MWNLIRHEWYKLWSQRIFPAGLAALCALNFFFLWNAGQRAGAGNDYRALGAALAEVPAAEQLSWLEAKREESYGLHQLEYYIENDYDQTTNHYYPSFLARWEAYGELYNTGDYLVFSDNLTDQYQMLENAYQQAAYVAKFHDRLAEIQNTADSMLQISIFGQGNYNQRNIEKTARDWAGLEEIEPQFQLQEFWHTVTDYAVTDYILIGMILFCSFFLIRQELERGILYYLWSMPAGRLKLAAAKWITLCGSLLILILLLYGANLCWCATVYPVGSLGAPVQSLAFLRDCTLQVSIGGYFLLYLAAKFLAACLLGSFLLLCALWGRQLYTAYLPAVGFVALNNLLYTAIPSFSTLNLLHYCNLFALLRTNAVLGEYQNLYWFGVPITKWRGQFLFGAAALALFVGLFLLLFLKKQRTGAPVRLRLPAVRIPLPRFLRRSGVVGTEFYKVFCKNGAAVVLALFLAFQGYQLLTTETYLTPDQAETNYYMQRLAGPYGEKQYQWLLAKQKQFAPLAELQQAYETGKLTTSEYEEQLLPLADLRQEYRTFQSIVAHLNYLREHPGAQFINEQGYAKLFGFQGDQNQSDALWAVLLCLLCCAGSFSVDYSSGMVRVIAATPRGRGATARAKILVALVVSVLITALVSLPHYLLVARDYGMTSILGAAYSLERFQNLPAVVTVSDLIVSSLLARLIAVFAMALVVLWISDATRDTMKTLLVGGFLFLVPIFLSIYFTPPLRWLTLYPAFQFAPYLSVIYRQGWSAAGSLLWLMALGALAVTAVVPFFGSETTFTGLVRQKILQGGRRRG
ncbi:MAG TPA: ABC transporter permease subunit [Candidatus Pygmaiobacter gallistercoris]|nr:ABC transporter permease subunit [Candidatus Pygmaiobacter gallistercoris]